MPTKVQTYVSCLVKIMRIYSIKKQQKHTKKHLKTQNVMKTEKQKALKNSRNRGEEDTLLISTHIRIALKSHKRNYRNNTK